MGYGKISQWAALWDGPYAANCCYVVPFVKHLNSIFCLYLA